MHVHYILKVLNTVINAGVITDCAWILTCLEEEALQVKLARVRTDEGAYGDIKHQNGKQSEWPRIAKYLSRVELNLGAA